MMAIASIIDLLCVDYCIATAKLVGGFKRFFSFSTIAADLIDY